MNQPVKYIVVTEYHFATPGIYLYDNEAAARNQFEFCCVTGTSKRVILNNVSSINTVVEMEVWTRPQEEAK